MEQSLLATLAMKQAVKLILLLAIVLAKKLAKMLSNKMAKMLAKMLANLLLKGPLVLHVLTWVFKFSVFSCRVGWLVIFPLSRCPRPCHGLPSSPGHK
jgi:hypothetical protein